MGALRFRLFGFPVEIQPGFWLLALLLSWRNGAGVGRTVAFASVVFVSVLVHELGHAVAARRYGFRPAILLHTFGGVTAWAPTHEIGRGAHIVVTLAGPAAGATLGALAFGGFLLTRATGLGGEPLSWLCGVAALANLVWTALNLLPVLPFDGGQVLLQALGPRRSTLAASVSLVFGLIVAGTMLWRGWVFGAGLFALGGVSSFFAVRRREQQAVAPERIAEIVQRARQALDTGSTPEAVALVRVALSLGPDPTLRRSALATGAWATLVLGDVATSRAVLGELLLGGPVDAYLEAAVLDAEGRPAEASARLVSARTEGDSRLEVAALLARASLAAGDPLRALAVTREIIDQVDPGEVRRVIDESEAAGAAQGAAELALALYDRTGDGADALSGARALAVAGDRERALDVLERAVRAGRVALALLRDDAKLASLRDEPRFTALFAAD